ncbi:hypothetical protein NIES4071_04630 [Calothrix sp. NIES-4071]|nr:hypothetical protein NIES4071_04630 [Calothrix sp. NIES-4071]BAZ54809.1 hypothetical protein NIES4105_04620 [Calothrix sp. NIES-4105]
MEAAQAQVVPDTTLPNNSIVKSEQENTIITGGTSTGANLFHSFSQFSVRKGENVYFDNPDRVDNIIMRVTGRNISNIDGLIRAAGNVNLYLLNPNGIHFGQNAVLDIKGSLYLTTAESWKFPDSHNTHTPPLLQVSAPIGIQWGSIGNIQIDADLSSKNLSLTANNITITSNLTSTGDINLDAKFINLNQAVIKSVQMGNINLQADFISIANGSKLINNNTVDTNGGDITVSANNKLTIIGAKTGLFTDTTSNSVTNGGNIFLKAPTVEITDKARVTVSSQGSGKSGNLKLVSDNLTIEGGTLSAKTATDGGNLNVYAYSLLTLRDNATISTVSIGKGNGANINVQAGFILVNSNGDNDITTNVVQNSGGKIRILSNAIFGLEIRRVPTERSNDISVTSQNNGYSNIDITTLNIDPNRGVTELPISIVDVSKQINQTCSNQATANRFIIVGRGGLPLNTTEALSLNSGWIDWRRVDKEDNNSLDVSKQNQLVEANEWKVENGQITLVANHSTSPNVQKPNCRLGRHLHGRVSRLEQSAVGGTELNITSTQ